MTIPVHVSFSPSVHPFSVSTATSGTVTVRLFPGWVVRVRPWWS